MCNLCNVENGNAEIRIALMTCRSLSFKKIYAMNTHIAESDILSDMHIVDRTKYYEYVLNYTRHDNINISRE